MSGRAAKQEVEIKLRLADADQGRRLLRCNGFRVVRRRLFESNIVFDKAGLELRRRGALLRLRRAGRRCILTYKGPSEAGRHKSRKEMEVEIPTAETFVLILQQLGYQAVFRYEKYRTEYGGKGGGGIVTLDETPIGAFLELEGRPGWIDRTARRLGFSELDYITDSYGRLYLEFARRNPSAPADMVFRPSQRREA